jgi:CheY-like chemotaxis protein
MGNLEILRLTKRDGDEAEMLDDALTASQRGATLTKQLLSFGRKASLRPEVIDVNTVLSSLDHLMRRVIPATIEVDFVRATSLWPAALDAAQLESALLNLAINARDAMPDGGRITVETANFDLQAEDGPDAVAGLAPGNYVRVSVADTGAGMTDEVRSRAIEPFFTTKPVGKGSGMGLAMVHGFAEQSGGALEISSTPGQGTTIRLYFPVAHGAPTEDREQPRVRPQRASEHILLVEDEDPVRHTLARQLRLIGYTVTEATNGRAALAALEQSDAIDLMLTDIVIPGDLQGPALARRVRERVPGVPIIFMSGYPREEALRQNGLSDEDVLLMKPVQYDDLLSALRLNLKNRKAG